MRTTAMSGPVAVYSLNGRLLHRVRTSEQLPVVLQSLRARFGTQAFVLGGAGAVTGTAGLVQRQ